MEIIILECPTGGKFMGYITDDEGMFLPTGLFRNAHVLFFCGMVDGVTILQDPQGLVYLPADWLAREFPEHRQRIEELKKQLL